MKSLMSDLVEIGPEHLAHGNLRLKSVPSCGTKPSSLRTDTRKSSTLVGMDLDIVEGRDFECQKKEV